MASRERTVVVFLVAVFMATSLWGGDAKAAKWGLWNDPRPDIPEPADSVSPEPPASKAAVHHEAGKAPLAPIPRQNAAGQTVIDAGDPLPELSEPADSVSPEPPASQAAVHHEAGKAPLAPAPRQNAAGQIVIDADYLVGPGDQLDILVWKNETLTRSVTVLPEGKITVPLIGDVAASGKTVAQLKKEFETKLVKYIADPVVSIEVKQVNSQLIYVIGRVNSPGRFVLNSNVNVMQALALAGGCNPFARRNKIKIMRSDGDTTKAIPFRYDDVVDDDRMEQNILLKRGDVVVVP